MVDIATIPDEPTPLQEPDIWVRRLAELVRLGAVISPVLYALIEIIKKGICS